ncbi:hypothetical protein NIES4071_85740 [Calothrix sp. NIES-4071]|nr:hypothetical protein NIES4071_85740 [Calothrix sp. NIES-4071]BAZ62841.1 hypothetical protein NIES4105_85670 [Calothrix sp. NIES-4105]
MKNHLQGTDLGDWERYQHYMAERGRGALGEPMRFEEWTKLSREKPSAPPRQLGEDIIVKGEWGNFKSKVYGHAVIEHGTRRLAPELQNRARDTGKPQGHWKDDQFIIEAELLTPLEPGEHVINMNKPAGNIYLPDSTTLEGVMIVKVIRSKDLTLKTAYPFC